MATVADIIRNATNEIGSPYVYGAEGPSTFDCSGLMQWVFGLAGVKLPRTSQEQQRATTRVNAPQPGDLVFYGSPAYHVGLYIGDGKMIDAPKPGDRVQVESVWGTPTYGRVTGLVGGAVGSVVDGIAGAAGAASGIVSTVLGGARSVLLEALFLGAGVGLIGLGAVRLVSSQLRK